MGKISQPSTGLQAIIYDDTLKVRTNTNLKTWRKIWKWRSFVEKKKKEIEARQNLLIHPSI